MSDPSWEDAAKRLCDDIEQRAPDVMRRAADQLYEDLLYSVQDYLRNNALDNLGGELWRAKKDEREAREALNRIADALGVWRAAPDSLSWPPHGALADAILDKIQLLTAEPHEVGQ